MALYVRPTLVLTEALHLPARTSRDVQAACDPWFDLVGVDLDELRADLSSVRGGERIVRMEDCIRAARAGRYTVQLLSGHIGSGKSTELRWLSGRLEKDKEGRAFHVVFIDLERYLDIRDVGLPELLATMFAAILDDPELGKFASASTTAKKLWKSIVSWVKEAGVTIEGEMPVGVGKLKVTFKTSYGLQKAFRERAAKEVTSLMETLSDLIQEVRASLVKQGVEDLVLIVDKLDRMERLPLGDNTKRTTHDLFFLEQLPLIQNLPVHQIVTIPVTLHFTQGRLRQMFNGPCDVVLPMVAVRKRGEVVDAPEEAGIAALRALLARRIDLSVVFANEEAVRHAIVQSGGSIRDLFRIVTTGVLNKRDLGLAREDVDVVVKEFVSGMERLLQGRGILRDLHHIVKTGSFPEKFDDDMKQWLLYQLVVLEYNGETWYDVHPFARRTRAFRDADPAKAPA